MASRQDHDEGNLGEVLTGVLRDRLSPFDPGVGSDWVRTVVFVRYLALVVLMLLVACGHNETGPAANEDGPVAVGELGCPDVPLWGEFGSPNYQPRFPGLPSAEEAIRSALEPWRDRFGGEVVLFVEDRGSLVVDQRELVTVTVYEAVAGEWVVAGLVSCEWWD